MIAATLERGRELLRRQLVRRGITLSAGALATTLVVQAAAAPVPTGVALNTIKAATAYFSGQAAAGGCLSAKALTLAEETMRGIFLVKAKLVLAVLTISLVVGGVGWVSYKELARAQPGAVAGGAVQAQNAKPNAALSEKKEIKVATDVYGDPLPEGAVVRLGTNRYRHGAPLSNAVISPNGKFLAGTGTNGIQIWDAETGTTLHRISGLPLSILALAFTSDSQLLASADFGRANFNQRQLPSKIQFIEVATGKPVKQLILKLSDDVDASKGPDGKDPTPKLKGGLATIPYIAFLAGDRSVLINDGGPVVRLVDSTTGAEVRTFRKQGQPTSKVIAVAPDGKTLAVVDADAVRLSDAATGKQHLVISKHVGEVKPVQLGKKKIFASAGVTVVFAPDGKTLATGSGKGGVYVWDVATGKLVLTMEARDAKALGPIASMSFSPDGRNLVVSHSGETLRSPRTMVFWDLSVGRESRRTEFLNHGEEALFLPDGKTLLVTGRVYPVMMATARNENTFSFIDGLTGKPCRIADGHLSAIMDLAYSRDGLFVATIELGGSGTIRVWETGTGHLVSHGEDPRRGHPKKLVFSPQGNVLFVAFSDEIVLWDSKTGKPLRSFPAQGSDLVTLALAPDGTKLVSCDKDGTVRMRELASGKELRMFSIRENDPDKGPPVLQGHIAFSSDLTLAAFAQQDTGTIQIWDLATGKEIKRFQRGGRGTFNLLFSSDGRTLLEHTGTKTIFLWEVASGEQRRAVPNPAIARSVAFSPDNRRIALGEADRARLLGPKALSVGISISIYDVAEDRFVAALKGHDGTISSLDFSADGRFLASGSHDMTGLIWDVAALARPGPVVPLTANERAACWADLAGTAEDAYTSIWKLVSDKEAVSLLRENLQPAAALADEKEVHKLVAGLGNEQFAVRSQATKELTKLGLAAVPALRKSVVIGLPLETRTRVEELLRSIRNNELRSVRAIEVLEAINSPAARSLLDKLAKGRIDALQTREATASLARMAH